MKIGVLIDRLNFGGVEKIAIEEVAALRKINEDAHLLILRRKAVVFVIIHYAHSHQPKLYQYY